MVSKTVCAEVVGTAVFFSVCCDLISWLMVYGTKEYKRLNKNVSTLAQQMRAEKKRLDESKSKNGGKALDEARRKLTRLARVIAPEERSLNGLRVRRHLTPDSSYDSTRA
jgi:5-bromo-4-chloroindolyl phosphate hydrolysis protein